MKDYTVLNQETGEKLEITQVDLLGLKTKLEIVNESAGLSEYERVDDETRFIHIPNKEEAEKITYQILSCEPHDKLNNKVGGQEGNNNARKGTENMVKSLYSLRLPASQDKELRKRVKDSGLSDKNYFIEHMRL